MNKPRKRIAGSVGFLLYLIGGFLLFVIIGMWIIKMFVWPCVVSVARMIFG